MDIEGFERSSTQISEHKIVLEEEATIVWQRKYQMHPIYFLLVKQGIDELQEASIIYLVPYNEWVSPNVIVPRKLVNYENVWIIKSGIVSSKSIISFYHYKGYIKWE